MTSNKQEKSKYPVMWSERVGNELYVYFAGKLIYKRWYKKNSTEKRQPSLLLNIKGWLNEWIS